MNTYKIVLRLFLILLLFFGYAYGQDLTEEAKQHYEKGRQFYEEGKYKEAEEEFQKAMVLVSQEEKKRTPDIPEYTIGYDDVLYLNVWQDKDLSQELTVQPDGRISFPLAGEIFVIGLTISQLKKELIKSFKEYIKEPVISLSLRKVGGSRAIILGQVGAPGVYAIGSNTSVLELVALAGDFTSNSVCSSTILIRGGFQNPKGIRLNLTQAITKAAPNQNIRLLPGDIVYVPKKFIADVNYFVSQIISPLTQGISAYENVMKVTGKQ